MPRHRLIPVLVLVCIAALVAACGDSGDKSSSDATSQPAASSTGASGSSAATAGTSGASSSADSSVGASTAAPLPDGTLGANEVANVAGTGVTKDAFDHLLEIARAQQKSQGGEVAKAGTAEDDALRRQVMQVLVQNTIIKMEAERQGVKVDEAKVTKDLADFKKECCESKDDQYQKYLKDSSASEQDLTDQLRVRQLAQSLYDKVTTDVTVTDQEISDQYDKDKDSRYTTEESRKVAHILIDVAPTGKVDDKDLAKANEVLALVKKGEDFGALAKKYSADPGSKDTGGEYDDVRGTFVTEFEKAAFALKTGEVTPKPVKSSFGYHIIKALGDVKPKSVKPLDEVKADIKTELEQAKKDTAANDWFQKLLADYQAHTVFAPGYGLPPEADTTGSLPEGTTLPESTDTAAGDTATASSDSTEATSGDETATSEDATSTEDEATSSDSGTESEPGDDSGGGADDSTSG